MRSSSSSYSYNSTSNLSSISSPLSYTSSSSQLGGSFRRSSINSSGFGSRSDFSSSALSRDNPFQRDSVTRESLPARLFPTRSSSIAGRVPDLGSGSSRVTHDDETLGLLGRYGSGPRKVSAGSEFLKQRRQQQNAQFEAELGGIGSSSSSATNRRTSLVDENRYGLGASSGPSTSSSSNRCALPDAQDVSQNEYMQRLLAAHNRVDDLLRSRGLNSDDERKYLRAWEEIPIIREERYRRVRTPSSSSDSGLSTDNDSDRSNAEAAPPPEPPEVVTSDNFHFEQEEEDIQVVHTHRSLNKIFDAVTYTEKLKTIDVKLNGCAKPESTSKSYLSPCQPDQCTLSVTKSKELNASKKSDVNIHNTRATFPSRIREIVSMTLPAAPTPKVLENAKKILRKVSLNEKSKVETSKFFSPKERSEKTEKSLPERVFPLRVCASFTAGDNDQVKKPVLPKRRKTYDDNVKVQQKCVLASLKRKKQNMIPSTAEISIQHCSFYTINAKDAFAERNVRLNLRMTERAPKNCTAVISLPAPPRVAYVSLDITAFMMKPPPRRTKTQELPKPRTVGKLNRAFTVELEKEEKELRKVNRLKIPEYFLQSSAEAMEDFKNAKNGLKRVPIIGGFLIQPKPKVIQQPQSSLRRVGAIRRKPTPIKEEAVPYSDFCPTPSSPIPQIRIVRPIDPDPPPIARQRRAPPKTSASHLNLHGSLAHSAKPRGAVKNYESKQQQQHFAELSETDKLLIERLNSEMHIPRPRAIIRALSPFHAIRALKAQFSKTPEPPVLFIERPTPRMRSPTPCQEVRPIKLNHPTIKKKTQPRRHWLDFQIDLKRVDFEKHRARMKPCRRLIRWIPKWRRKGTDEEVEEVEEEEEQEEEVEIETSYENEKAEERTKTKSFTENEDGSLTEGERAMAAAKRRAEEEQQAKLMDYEERRRNEREKEEEELKKLKEKQERRKLEREQEELKMEEMRKAAEDRRRQEEEERKAKVEEEKRKKEEEKNKRNQLMGGSFNTAGGGGRNFTVPKKGTSNDKFGNIVQAKQEMGMTKDQQDEAKRVFMASIRKGILEVSEISASELKAKIKELHQRICKLEADKYDLEKRHERQEYDLKELNERQRQVTRNAALKKGIDPADVGNSRYPPKVQIVSKYDRQIDRRNFRERRSVFDKRNAHPCFPGVPPPPAIYEKIVAAVEAKLETKTCHSNNRAFEEIQTYLNSPDRCPKYTEKISTFSDSPSNVPSYPVKPRPLRIPSAFLHQG